jgi:hypothetical protein
MYLRVFACIWAYLRVCESRQQGAGSRQTYLDHGLQHVCLITRRWEREPSQLHTPHCLLGLILRLVVVIMVVIIVMVMKMTADSAA